MSLLPERINAHALHDLESCEILLQINKAEEAENTTKNGRSRSQKTDNPADTFRNVTIRLKTPPCWSLQGRIQERKFTEPQKGSKKTLPLLHASVCVGVCVYIVCLFECALLPAHLPTSAHV